MTKTGLVEANTASPVAVPANALHFDTPFLTDIARIALSAVHRVFHSEHDRPVDYIKNVLTSDTSAAGVAALPEWKPGTGSGTNQGWNGERLFRAARLVTRWVPAHGLRGVRPEDPAGDPP